MNFTKFVSMLDRQALFFTSADAFRDSDHCEGSLTNEFIRERANKFPGSRFISSDMARLMRKCTYLNCWHMNDIESYAMWEVYVKTKEGVAVQSTYRRLRDGFGQCQDDIHIGCVSYLNYLQDSMPSGTDTNTMAPFLYKRQQFSYEKELRVVVQDESKLEYPEGVSAVKIEADGTERRFLHPAYADTAQAAPGIEVPCDLECLVQHVYVSPRAPRWFAELVSSVLKRYGLNRSVISSELDSPAGY